MLRKPDPELLDDEAHQQAVIEASRRINRLCVVENAFLITSWTHGRAVGGPLEAYIQSDFVPAYTFGDYTILVRRSLFPARVALTHTPDDQARA